MADREGGWVLRSGAPYGKGEPRVPVICHCRRTARGSGEPVFVQPRGLTKLDYQQSGETMVFIDEGDSGHPVHRHFWWTPRAPRCWRRPH